MCYYPVGKELMRVNNTVFLFQLKRLFHGDGTRETTVIERFCAGSMAGAISQTIIYPMEVIRGYSK